MFMKKRTIFAIFSIAVLSSITPAQSSISIYGYFSTRLEKSFAVPSISAGSIIKEDGLAEWSTPYFNVMMSHQIDDNAKVFVNLNGAKASTIDVKNYWGEYTFNQFATVRLGKIYRKFGLYNEILDAVPTYFGIEPPELFDADHLILSRTTTAMVYGNANIEGGQLRYSLSTDNGESGSPIKETPVGYDVNYLFGSGNYVVGLSGYTSGGYTTSDVKLGSGSPKSGVLPWQSGDKFSVIGGYAEVKISNLTMQAEYWTSPHTIQRDTAKVKDVITKAGVNANQRNRFLINSAGTVSETNVRVNDSYTVATYYFRAGYSIETSLGEFGPYLQFDWYRNQETISNKTYGGDEEAGEADNGEFTKYTAGIVFRPILQVAAKLDISSHNYRLNNSDVSYPEVRFDISYLFGQ